MEKQSNYPSKNQLEEELIGYIREIALEGRANPMEAAITHVRKISKESGIDISKQISETQKIGYRNAGKHKLEDGKHWLEKKNKDMARFALYLCQTYSSKANDEATFFEAEEIMEDLKNKSIV